MFIAPQGLRGEIDGDRSPVGLAPFVEALPEISDQQITAHLEVGNCPLKVLFALLAESGQAFERKLVTGIIAQR